MIPEVKELIKIGFNQNIVYSVISKIFKYKNTAFEQTQTTVIFGYTCQCKINKRKGSGEVLLDLYSSLREEDYSCYWLVENCRYLNENKVSSRASLVNLTITRGTDALCHWKLFAILMVEKNQLGSGQFSAAFSECLCLCTFSASLGF